MTLPNFLIIGAAKSGTTALYQYLKQHPQIYMSPIKEPHFFGLEGENLNFQGPTAEQYENRSITNIEDYRALFQGVLDEIAIGEASNSYLYLSKAPERIKYYIPSAKLIAILRNPVDRAYSSFLNLMRTGGEPLNDFPRALREEETRIRSNWGFLHRYQDLGFYYVQLKRYFEIFDSTQIRVYLYDDLRNNPVRVLQDIFKFIGVDVAFVPDMSTKFNVSGIPKNKVLHNFLTGENPIKTIFRPFLPANLRAKLINRYYEKGLDKPQLSAEVRHQLIHIYREDILKLQDLSQRDLSGWLK